jgi:hypothetical protein
VNKGDFLSRIGGERGSSRPGAARPDLAQLYASSGAALREMADGGGDTRRSQALADAINRALHAVGRARPLAALIVRREKERTIIATRVRPALLSSSRIPYDGKERETTLVLPPQAKDVEPTLALADAFFEQKPVVAKGPIAGELVVVTEEHRNSSEGALPTEAVQQCADTIAMLARHRAERPAWELAENEAQLLACVDAVATAGGDSARDVVDWWRASDSSWRTWAAAFILSSLEGIDVLEAIVRELEALPLEAVEQGERAAEALLVAPHPHVPELARELVGAGHPVARAVGAEVLARRGLLSAEELSTHLLDSNMPVLRAAVRACGRVLSSEVGIPLLLPYRHHPDAGIAWSAARQLALWGRPEPYFDIRAGRCRALGVEALEILIQFGDASDLERFDGIVGQLPASEALISAIARYGSPSAWALLLHHLADPDLSEAAANGLRTLFGELVPPAEVKNAATWRRAIASAKLDPHARYRRGQPWRVQTVVDECRGGALSRRELEVRLDELVVRTAVSIDIDFARWSSDVLPMLGRAMDVMARADAAYRAGSWDCKSAGFRS